MDNQNQNTNKRITWNEQDFPIPQKPEIGIEFFNVNSGETRICDNEALITAFYNSSNLHPNAMVGQDMGWRLAKDTIRRMRTIQDDDEEMERVVRKFRLNDETEITDSHILTYMFQKDLKRRQKAEAQKQNAHLQKYEQDIRSLDEEPGDDFAEEDDDEFDTTQLGPRRTTATAAPARRLSPEEAKLLADARKREANIAAGRPVNEGIDMPADQGQDQVSEDELGDDDTTTTEDKTETETETTDTQTTTPPVPNKPVAKPRGKSNNRNQS